MRGDFSRTTFRSDRHYSAVHLQQGRVLLDADFNEQSDLQRHRDRTLTADVAGASGAPAVGGGFAVRPSAHLHGAAGTPGGTAFAVGSQGTLLSAASGGTWEAIESPAGLRADLDGVAFADDQHGWAVG